MEQPETPSLPNDGIIRKSCLKPGDEELIATDRIPQLREALASNDEEMTRSVMSPVKIMVNVRKRIPSVPYFGLFLMY